jgi:hypothetical protein
VTPREELPVQRTARGKERAHKEHTMADRLFFPTESINWADDESIDTFARAVWQQAVDEFTKDEPGNDVTEKNEDQGEQDF